MGMVYLLEKKGNGGLEYHLFRNLPASSTVVTPSNCLIACICIFYQVGNRISALLLTKELWIELNRISALHRISHFANV
jgi:hypothetical protein